MRAGFVWLGNVGGRLAGSLLRNGHALVMRDLDSSMAAPLPERPAGCAERPAQCAAA